MTASDQWPALPYAVWRGTRDTLHLYTQIVGKIRLSLAPFERNWNNVPFYLTARGLTTGPMPSGDGVVQIDFDFTRHAIDLVRSDGRARSIALVPARCVADVYAEVIEALRALGVDAKIWPVAVEIGKPIRLDADRAHASYDPDEVQGFFRALVRIATVFGEHRAMYRGKHTPLHFWWGSFDLSYVRYSGRDADPPPNADSITRLAMDAEEISAGFWPGDERFPEAAFYCYAYPKPDGIETTAIRPAAAGWNAGLGEWVLRYDDVRAAASPQAVLREFLASCYDTAARRMGWDR
jgi:hypothetical protein